MTLKEHGFEKFGRLVAQNMRQARYLGELVDAEPRLGVMATVALNVVPFRFAPRDLKPAVLDQVNRELLIRIQEQGIAVPSHTQVGGRFTIRGCICNHRSRREDFDLLVREVLRIGEEIMEEVRLVNRERSETVVRLRPTVQTYLEFVLRLEADTDTAPFIHPWPIEEHRAAIADPCVAHWIVENATQGVPVGFVILRGLGSEVIEFRRIAISEKGRGYGNSSRPPRQGSGFRGNGRPQTLAGRVRLQR